jgi:hypothetical protein
MMSQSAPTPVSRGAWHHLSAGGLTHLMGRERQVTDAQEVPGTTWASLREWTAATDAHVVPGTSWDGVVR